MELPILTFRYQKCQVVLDTTLKKLLEQTEIFDFTPLKDKKKLISALNKVKG